METAREFAEANKGKLVRIKKVPGMDLKGREDLIGKIIGWLTWRGQVGGGHLIIHFGIATFDVALSPSIYNKTYFEGYENWPGYCRTVDEVELINERYELTPDKLVNVLEFHRKFLKGKPDGNRMSLYCATLKVPSIVGYDLSLAIFRNVDFSNVTIDSCDLTGAEFYNCTFHKTCFKRNTYTDAYFQGCDYDYCGNGRGDLNWAARLGAFVANDDDGGV